MDKKEILKEFWYSHLKGRENYKMIVYFLEAMELYDKGIRVTDISENHRSAKRFYKEDYKDK